MRTREKRKRKLGRSGSEKRSAHQAPARAAVRCGGFIDIQDKFTYCADLRFFSFNFSPFLHFWCQLSSAMLYFVKILINSKMLAMLCSELASVHHLLFRILE
jgi:hypothetical protein